MSNPYGIPERSKDRGKGEGKGKKKRSFMNRLVGAIPEPVRITPGDVGRVLPKPVRSESLKALGTTLTVLSKPGEATKALIKTVGEDSYKGKGALHALAHGVEQAGEGLIGKEHTTATEMTSAMLTGRKDQIKKLPFGVSTAIDTVVDPTTYVSFGQSAAVKAGLKTVGESLGEEAVKNIAKGGLKKAVTAAERRQVRNAIVQKALANGRTLNRAEKIADKQMRAMARGARGGAKVGGYSLPGLGNESAIGRAAIKVSPKAAAGRGLARTATGRSIKAAFVRGANTDHIIGKEGRERLMQAVRESQDATEADQAIAYHAMDNAARAAGVDAEKLAKVADALDVSQTRNALHKGVEQTGKAARKAENEAGHWGQRAADLYEQAQRRVEEARSVVNDTKAAYEDEAAKYGTASFDPARITALGRDLNVANRKLVGAAKAVARGEDTRQGVGQIARVLRGKADEAGRTAEGARTALAGHDPAAEAAATLRAQGDEGTAKLIDTADQMRRRFTDESLAKGTLNKAHEVETYLPRYATKHFRQALADHADRIVTALSVDGHKVAPSAVRSALDGGEQAFRRLRPDLSIREINQLLVDEGILKPGQKAFDDNPLVAILTRQHKAAAANHMTDLLEKLTTVVDDQGRPLLRKVDAAADLGVDQGVFSPELAQQMGKQYAAHPEVLKVLSEAAAVTTNDEALRTLQQLSNGVAKTWRGMATFGPGFHARNEAGNLWLNFLGGVKSPRPYIKAAKLQKAAHDAFKALGPEADLDAVLAASKLSDSDRFLLKEAVDRGVLGRGFFAEDLAGPASKLTGDKGSKLLRGVRGLNTANRTVGSAVENNARMAHFVYKMDTLGDSQAAAESVKKFLFDYGDLTPTERRLKKFIPFYTFMRKNTPLQIEQALKQPGKFAFAAHLKEDAQEHGIGYFPDLPINAADQNLRILTGVPDARSNTTDPLQIRLQAAAGPLEPFSKSLIEGAAGSTSFSGVPLRTNEALRENMVRNLVPVSKYLPANFKKKSLLESILGLDKLEKPEGEGSSKAKAKPKRKRPFD